MSFDELEMIISGLDILQIQSRTLRGFFNSPYEGTFSIEEYNWYIDKLSKHHKWLIIEDEENGFVGGVDEPGHQLSTDIFSQDLKMQRGFMSKIVFNWVYHRFFDKKQ